MSKRQPSENLHSAIALTPEGSLLPEIFEVAHELSDDLDKHNAEEIDDHASGLIEPHRIFPNISFTGNGVVPYAHEGMMFSTYEHSGTIFSGRPIAFEVLRYSEFGMMPKNEIHGDFEDEFDEIGDSLDSAIATHVSSA